MSKTTEPRAIAARVKWWDGKTAFPPMAAWSPMWDAFERGYTEAHDDLAAENKAFRKAVEDVEWVVDDFAGESIESLKAMICVAIAQNGAEAEGAKA